MDTIKIRNIWLQPTPTVPGVQLDPRQVTLKSIFTKYVQFQSPLLNRGTIYLANDPQICAAKEGTCLRPGSTYTIDIDMNRNIGVDLADYFYAGNYAGDQLIVSYLLEEQQNG